MGFFQITTAIWVALFLPTTLEQKIRHFIEYFNRHLAKPYRWTYEGKALKK